MVKSVFAYGIVLFLAPIISGLCGIPFLLLLNLISKLMGEKRTNTKLWVWFCDVLLGAMSVFTGFIAIWVGMLIFSALGKTSSVLMVLMLGIGFGINDFRIILLSLKTIIRQRLIAFLGHLLGIVIGGAYFL